MKKLNEITFRNDNGEIYTINQTCFDMIAISSLHTDTHVFINKKDIDNLIKTLQIAKYW